MRRYLCGVKDGCSGSMMETPLGMVRVHLTSESAFACKCQEMRRQGYTRVGSRAFCLDSGPVRILTKPSHYGAELTGGKREKQTGKRCAFKGRTGGSVF